MQERPIQTSPIERTDAHRLVQDRIRALLAEGSIRPGDRLPSERDLADMLGVSRGTLRRALAALEAQGLVSARHGAGTFVRPDLAPELLQALASTLVQQNEDLPPIMEARRALELELARLAARRRTEADLARMAGAIDAMRADIEGGGRGEQGDAEFHAALWEAGRSPVLRDLLGQLEDGIARLRQESLAQAGRPARSLAAHRRILEAVDSGDPARSQRAMSEHLAEVADALLVEPAPPGRRHFDVPAVRKM